CPTTDMRTTSRALRRTFCAIFFPGPENRSPRGTGALPFFNSRRILPRLRTPANILADLRDESMNSSQAKKQPYPCMRKRRVLVGPALLALALLLMGAASFPFYGVLAAADDDAAIAMRLADLLRSA